MDSERFFGMTSFWRDWVSCYRFSWMDILGKSPGKLPNRKSKTNNLGFTLVELLVVIAIVGVLAALLLPAINKAGERSHIAKCAGNLRALGQASLLYSNDNEGWMLQSVREDRQPWTVALFPYIDAGPNPWFYNLGKRPASVFACPSSKWKVDNNWCSDYAKNAAVNWEFGSLYAPALKQVAMNSMSKIIFLADACFNPETTEGQLLRGRDLSPGAPAGRIHARHNKVANVLFYDGHVELLNPWDQNSVPTGEGAWNSPPWVPSP